MGVLLIQTYQQTLGFSEFCQDLHHHILCMVHRLQQEEEEEEDNHLYRQEDKPDDSHHHNHPHLHLHLRVKEVMLLEERDSDQGVCNLMIIHNHHLEDKEADPQEEEVEEEEDHLDHSNQVQLCHDLGESLEETPLV